MVLTAAIVLCAVIPAYAIYSVSDTGDWPKSWPKELEPLRKQARTLVGPEVENRHYGIRFTKREEFESAWPQLLKVRNKSAPIFLQRGSNFYLGDKVEAGVVVHTPPAVPPGKPALAEGPIESENPRTRWMYTTYLEVVPDGKIIDWSRIQVPKGVTIIDERTKDTK
jgi:hypothetical protein